MSVWPDVARRFSEENHPEVEMTEHLSTEIIERYFREPKPKIRNCGFDYLKMGNIMELFEARKALQRNVSLDSPVIALSYEWAPPY